MFSKRTLMIVGVIVVVAINVIVLAISSRRHAPSSSLGRVAVQVVSPFQGAVTGTIHFCRDIWHHYFHLVAVSIENEALNRMLGEAMQRQHVCEEIERANDRLRSLLNFQKSTQQEVLAAQVIGQNPSPWYRTVVIDKGARDGVRKGMPVVVHQGIVGQVMASGSGYAKVLLITDQNNAVDALVERNRARGIVSGNPDGVSYFRYVLRKSDVKAGDTLISSGLDGVFPKGLQIGSVSSVVRRTSGIFQEVTVNPFVDFDKLEEVLVLVSPAQTSVNEATEQ
jgi:rod shape-determining protein MreC